MTPHRLRVAGLTSAGMMLLPPLLAACGSAAPKAAAGTATSTSPSTPPSTAGSTGSTGPAPAPTPTTPAAPGGTTATTARPSGAAPTTTTAVRNTLPPASTTTAPTTTTTSGGGAVTAVETEYHIALSRSSLTPGRWVFTAKNSGSLSHNLVINGPGVSQDTSPLLAPGQSAQLTVTLEKGTYDVYCGVPGHKEAGMDTTVTVS